MALNNSEIFLIVCLIMTLNGGISSQNNADNYLKMKNQDQTMEYKFTGDVEDFSQLHSTPLGPLSNFLGNDNCFKGVLTLYFEINFGNISWTYSSKEEICYSDNLRGFNSVRLQGSASSKFVYLYAEEDTVGPQLSYSADMPNITLPNTNSLLVVGAGVSATFYSLPNYGGASVCVSVGNGTIVHNRIHSTTTTFGFTTIKSFKFGCNSKKIIHPSESNIPDTMN